MAKLAKAELLALAAAAAFVLLAVFVAVAAFGNLSRLELDWSWAAAVLPLAGGVVLIGFFLWLGHMARRGRK